MINMTQSYGQEQAPKIERPTYRGHLPSIGRVSDASVDPAPCREMPTRTCPESYKRGGCGARPCARLESDDPHPWQEFNEHGNTCHHPGCTLAQDEHS